MQMNDIQQKQMNFINNQVVKNGKFNLFIKLTASVALPLAIGIFTLVTTLQNRDIAGLYREQDRRQNDFQRAEDSARATDEQRELVYVDYINDVSRFRQENVNNWTQDKLLYIEIKTLVTLRKVDSYRKRQIFQFLRESRMLMTTGFVLNGADFMNIELDGLEYILSNSTFLSSHFQNASFINCYFISMILSSSNFKNGKFIHSTLTNVTCMNCQFEYTEFNDVRFINSTLNGTNFAYALFNSVQFSNTYLMNVNLTGATLHDTDVNLKDFVFNSILPNGTFSSIYEQSLIGHGYNCSRSRWKLEYGDIEIQSIYNSTGCLYINKANRSQITYEFDLLFYTLLINTNQANFVFTFDRHDNMDGFSVSIQVINGRYGLYSIIVFEEQTCENTRCFLIKNVPARTETAKIQINMYGIDTLLSNIELSICKRQI